MKKSGPDRIFQMASFWQTRVLQTGVLMGVFDALAGGPCTAAQLARRLGARARSLELLLNALVGIDLLAKRGQTYANTRETARYLVASSEDCIAANVAHGAYMWNSWGRLEEAVRTNAPVRHERLRNRAPEQLRAFILAMHSGGRAKGERIARALDLKGRTHLADIGGGPGTYAIMFCRAHPALRATVVDRKEVLPITREVVASYGLEERFDFLACDVAAEPRIPTRYDVAWVSNLIHSFGAHANLAMLRKVIRSLEPGGMLYLQDFLLDTTRTKPVWPAVFALNMLVHTDGGRTYTSNEVKDWFRRLGLRKVRRLKVALANGAGIIAGYKPARRQTST
ncbi:MAG: methyltransferase domain-containing protein [Verrucomicrobia bacterium]|nr:methyltransferase domain-containing protein [Verrucomicrobiota bacterium]